MFKATFILLATYPNKAHIRLYQQTVLPRAPSNLTPYPPSLVFSSFHAVPLRDVPVKKLHALVTSPPGHIPIQRIPCHFEECLNNTLWV